MRILVLGGTAWLGGEIVRSGLSVGHEVVCLARGESGRVPAEVRWVRADRTRADAYREVVDEEWDVVIDVARQPGQVRDAVTALADRARTWVFVSSGNVYADHATPGRDESAPLLPALPGDVMDDMETYGEAKVACERHVLNRVGVDRALVARVGLIGGPGDPFDRSGYWPWRFARPSRSDGAVLIPDAPALPVQLVDVRDLAGWLVRAGAAGTTGIMNVAGPVLPLSDHLDVARQVAGHAGPLVRADAEWLAAHGVQAWMGPRSLPLWLDDPDWYGFNALDTGAAVRAGLRTRPLAETLADTLAWELARAAGPRRAGLSDDEERALLDELDPATADRRNL